MAKITREATVVQVTDNEVIVQVCRESACKSCSARKVCSSGSEDGSGHQIRVAREHDGRKFEVGEQVNIIMEQSRALYAVVLAYLFPVFMALGLLFMLQRVEVSELMAGLLTLGVLGLYFVVVSLFKQRLGAKIKIRIE